MEKKEEINKKEVDLSSLKKKTEKIEMKNEKKDIPLHGAYRG